MVKSQKTRRVVALSAGVAVGLSATAIVLMQSSSTPSERLKLIQSALRDGVAKAKVNPGAPLIQLTAAER